MYTDSNALVRDEIPITVHVTLVLPISFPNHKTILLSPKRNKDVIYLTLPNGDLVAHLP